MNFYECVGKIMDNEHINYKYVQFMEIENNVLIQSICINAKLPSEKRMHFLDVIPRKLVAVHSDPLIFGYLRQNRAADFMHKDLVEILRCFFF